MAAEPGRRERKKLQTRQTLIAEALRLFEEQGYEQTTVASIAEAADVSTRTFFLHFSAKEDVLLANVQMRVDTGLDAIAQRHADEPPNEALNRAVEQMIVNSWDTEVTTGLSDRRARLLATSPTARARLMQRFLQAQTEITDALLHAYPDELDEVEAATAVGMVTGAVGAASLASIARGDSPEQIRRAMQRANDRATR